MNPGDESHNFTSWNFDVWGISIESPHSLYSLLCLIADRHQLLGEPFGVDQVTWINVITKTDKLMASCVNPYHNFVHVVDVTQSCSVIIGDMDGKSLLERYEVFAVLVAALVHDLGHPGVNNAYEVNAQTQRAIIYNDVSVLENFHSATAFELFQNPDTNIFANMDKDLRKKIRKTMIAAILSTDMVHHFGLKDDVDSCNARYSSPSPSSSALTSPASVYSDADRLTFVKAILHCADVSNPAKTWSISKKWSDLVIQEFFAQGDREKAESLPVSMGCDRATAQQDEISLNFTDFIVAPFFVSLTNTLPKLKVACEFLLSNRDEWHRRLEERLVAGSTGERSESVAEVMVKWNARKVSFQEKHTAAIKAAEDKLFGI